MNGGSLMSHILVIENETVACKQIQETLEQAGHEVVVSADGHSGLAQCEE
jgi:CheY-like chemotaxis protein